MGFARRDTQTSRMPVEIGCVPPFTRDVIGREMSLVLGRELTPLVQDHSLTLSSPPRIPCQGRPAPTAVLHAGDQGRLNRPASEPPCHPVGLLPGGGGSLRHIALLCSVLFVIPRTKASIQGWLDAIGAHVPPPPGGASAMACAHPRHGGSP